MSSRDALLLIGHGSVRYPGAGDVLHQHADVLRARAEFAQVEVAMLNGHPSVAEALGGIATPVVRVVPFFMEDGYFSRVAIPKALAQHEPPGQRCDEQTTSRRIIMCPPVGVHDRLSEIIEHQALSASSDLGIAPETAAVVVAGHGSATAPGRALALHRHAAHLAARSQFARVEAACLEEPPYIADTLARLRPHPTLVIGFFANHGGHVRDDMPALVATEQASRSASGLVVHFCGPVADAPAMLQIILEQTRDGQRLAG